MGDEFQVGEVLSSMGRVLRQRWGTVLGLFVLGEICILLIAGALVLLGWPGSVLGVILFFGITIALFTVLISALMTLTVAQLRGRTMSALAALTHASTRVLPVLAVGAATGVSVTVGLGLFVVPGVLLALVIGMAVPVSVIEPVSIIKSFTRSAELTRDHRLQLLGLDAMLWGAFFLLNILTTAVRQSVLALPVSLLASAFLMVIVPVAWGAAYVGLRSFREGKSEPAIANVFS